jgi:hypothetical protein
MKLCIYADRRQWSFELATVPNADDLRNQLSSTVDFVANACEWYSATSAGAARRLGNVYEMSEYVMNVYDQSSDCEKMNMNPSSTVRKYSYDNTVHVCAIHELPGSAQSAFDLFNSACSRLWFGQRRVISQAMFLCADRTPVCFACAIHCHAGSPQASSETLHATLSRYCCECSKCAVVDVVAGNLPTVCDSKGPSTSGLWLEDACTLHSLIVSLQEYKMYVDVFRRHIEKYLKVIRLQYSELTFDEFLQDETNSLVGSQPTLAELHSSLTCISTQFGFRRMRSGQGPPCPCCGKETRCVGKERPSSEEVACGAEMTEIHRCIACSTNNIRFPRYFSADKLRETRCGRCGECAFFFYAYCRARGWNVRLVLADFQQCPTDHVWNEVYVPQECRWVHVDYYHNLVDNPLWYEKELGTVIPYAIGVNEHELRDVTQSYTANYERLLQIPHRNIESEDVSQILSDLVLS